MKVNIYQMTPEAAAKVQHTLNVANLDRVDGNDVDTESDEEVVVEVPHTYEVITFTFHTCIIFYFVTCC